MRKVLISIPDKIAQRMRATIPLSDQSKVILRLLENEIEAREKALYACAVAVEQDAALQKDMKAWDVSLHDGLVWSK